MRTDAGALEERLHRAYLALAHYRDNGTLCPCGARPENPAEFPHVIGCPVGIAEDEAPGGA